MNQSYGAGSSLVAVNSLCCGLLLLTAFALVATRQMKDCLWLFIAQSVLLAASALLLGFRYQSWHLAGVGLVNLVAKPFVIPWILRRTTPAALYTRREIEQVFNVSTSLLIALALAIFGYFVGAVLQQGVALQFRSQNVPVGLAALLLGAYSLAVRREAVPLLLGILAMENGALLVGIAIARDLPMLVEVAIATDGFVMVFILGVLTRAVHTQMQTTDIGSLAALREEI